MLTAIAALLVAWPVLAQQEESEVAMEEIEMADVPEAGISTLENETSGFQPDYIERSTRPREGDQIVYEFEGTHDSSAVDAEINEDGSNSR